MHEAEAARLPGRHVQQHDRVQHGAERLHQLLQHAVGHRRAQVAHVQLAVVRQVVAGAHARTAVAAVAAAKPAAKARAAPAAAATAKAAAAAAGRARGEAAGAALAPAAWPAAWPAAQLRQEALVLVVQAPCAGRA